MNEINTISNLQQELLKIYSSDISEEDLLYIKRYLAKYFAEKAVKEADEIAFQKGYTGETMNQWLNEDKADYETKSGH